MNEQNFHEYDVVEYNFVMVLLGRSVSSGQRPGNNNAKLVGEVPKAENRKLKR